MNKGDLTTKVTERTGLKKNESEAAVNAIFDSIAEALGEGDKVQIIGFGTFETRERAERTGRNPQTGEEMVVPASTVPAFKAGAGLKEKVK